MNYFLREKSKFGFSVLHLKYQRGQADRKAVSHGSGPVSPGDGVDRKMLKIFDPGGDGDFSGQQKNLAFSEKTTGIT